ncbi:MAG TPA: hypothetical protein VFJ90_00350, partial [Candidatus Didemnitutus sp.]|nr:hypothetical protein [Candidatus Didemnitutus sp.]
AGFDAHLALVNRRSMILFDPVVTEKFMVPDTVVAVRLEGVQRFFDPGATYLPFGALAPENSNTAILVADPQNGKPGYTEGTRARDNTEHRRAHFTIEADGTIEGDVTETYTGLREAEMKNLLHGLTPTERGRYFRDALKEDLKQAELTAIKILHADDPLDPLSVTYHLRVPEYADRTGSRIFIQPGIFQKNVPPLFPSAKRRADLMFGYGNEVHDEITFTLPENYAVEEASVPSDVDIGDLGKYVVELGRNPATGDIHYRRTMTTNGVYLPAKMYEPVRQAFDAISQRDAHTLALKRKDPTPAGTATSSEAKSSEN